MLYHYSGRKNKTSRSVVTSRSDLEGESRYLVLSQAEKGFLERLLSGAEFVDFDSVGDEQGVYVGNGFGVRVEVQERGSVAAYFHAEVASQQFEGARYVVDTNFVDVCAADQLVWSTFV